MAEPFDCFTCLKLKGNPCAPCDQNLILEARISAAKAQILSAQRELHEVQTIQRHLRTEINHIHDPLTSRLPLELVSEVFKYTLDQTSGMGVDSYNSRSPLFLGAICRSWRNVAWSSPSLWNWINIHFQLPTSEYMEELVEEWLNRSGKLPLTLFVSSDIAYYDVVRSDVDNVIHSVNHHSIRWKDVYLQCHPSLVRRFTGNGRGAPNLRCLTVEPIGNGTDLYIRGDADGLLAQPSHVTILCCRSVSLNISWARLTKVYFDELSLRGCFQVMREAPNLLHGQFRDVDDFDFWDSSNEAFVHQTLQTLEFSSSKDHDREMFLDCLTLPALVDLTIEISVENTESLAPLLWKNSIEPFIVRASGRLTSLALRYPWSSDNLVELLEATPLLRQLSLEYDPSLNRTEGGRFLSHLARTSSSNTNEGPPLVKFLPNLHKFSFGGFMIDTDSDENEAQTSWKGILDICGPLSQIGNPLLGRPLDTLTIKRSLHNFDVPVYVDPESIHNFLKFAHAGITFRLRDWFLYDIIKLSMDHHGINSL